jgi:hypothetical protein
MILVRIGFSARVTVALIDFMFSARSERKGNCADTFCSNRVFNKKQDLLFSS